MAYSLCPLSNVLIPFRPDSLTPTYKLQEQVDLHTQGQEFKQSIQIIVLNQIHDPFSLKGVQNSKL